MLTNAPSARLQTMGLDFRFSVSCHADESSGAWVTSNDLRKPTLGAPSVPAANVSQPWGRMAFASLIRTPGFRSDGILSDCFNLASTRTLETDAVGIHASQPAVEPAKSATSPENSRPSPASFWDVSKTRRVLSSRPRSSSSPTPGIVTSRRIVIATRPAAAATC